MTIDSTICRCRETIQIDKRNDDNSHLLEKYVSIEF